MKKILLINPESAVDTELPRWGEAQTQKFVPFEGVRATLPPLALVTLAAITPDQFAIEIWDEQVKGRIENSDGFDHYDIVGITGYSAHHKLILRLAKIFRRPGTLVVGGGPGISATPLTYRDEFDTLFLGEAEHTWIQFLADFENNSVQKEYQQILKPDMTKSPMPKWDALKDDLKYYMSGAVQTTRGCPFDCDFCDVISLFGRRPRHKSVEQVIDEVKVLEGLGVSRIYFVDDNFIGDAKFAKDLLKKLIPVNNSFDRPMSFQTQLTLNVAKDEELVKLIADVNFSAVYIGIETANKASLKEANKPQNLNTDIVVDVKKIQSHGVLVRAGLIVGFDNDDKNIFDEMYEFIQEACLLNPDIHLLTVPYGTKIWARMLKEGRIIKSKDSEVAMGNLTNLVPKQMTRSELLSGYKGLLDRVVDWDGYAERLQKYVDNVNPELLTNRPAGANQPQNADRTFALQLMEAIESRTSRRAILDILLQTRKYFPSIVPKVFYSILLHYVSANNELKSIDVENQIAFENDISDYEPYIVKSTIVITEKFRQAYNLMFVELFEYISNELTDKALIPDTMVEVVTDFLFRWGETFEELEKQHEVSLFEMADRAIAARNSKYEFLGASASDYALADFTDQKKLKELRIEVLKSVERDMSFGTTESSFVNLRYMKNDKIPVEIVSQA